MSRNQRNYDHEYKIQAVKLAKEIGGAKAALDNAYLAHPGLRGAMIMPDVKVCGPE